MISSIFFLVKNLDIAIRSSQNSVGLKKIFYCKICDIRFSEFIELKAHQNSPQHNEICKEQLEEVCWTYRDLPPHEKLSHLTLCQK